MLSPILHWILQFAFNWHLIPLSLLLHHIVLGFGSKFKWIWGSTSLVWKGSGAFSREGMPCSFSLTRACGFRKMIKNIVKNWVILTSNAILGHCSAHCYFWSLLMCNSNNTAPLNLKKNCKTEKKASNLFQNWSCVHTSSHNHLGL